MCTCSARAHSAHVMSRGRMHVCWYKLCNPLNGNMLIICLFKAQMSSDTAGSLHAVVNWSESFRSRRTGTLTNRDHCVHIPHDRSLDGPRWNLWTVSFFFYGEFQQCEWVYLHRMTDGDRSFFRVKMAEECFKQAREKASYNVKPKHATGIVRLYASYHSYCMVWSVLLLVKTLFLTNACQGVEETTLLAPTVTHRDECRSCQLEITHHFFYPTESKAGSEDLKQRMENYHHQAYCTSTVCTIWQWLISHFYNIYLLPVLVFNWFRPVVYCELVQSGYYSMWILYCLKVAWKITFLAALW